MLKSTATKSEKKGKPSSKDVIVPKSDDEIQLLLLFRKAKELKNQFPNDFKSLKIDLTSTMVLTMTKNDDTDIAADEFIRQKNYDDPIVFSNLRLSQVKARAKSRLNKEINSLDDLSKEERSVLAKSNRSFLAKEEKKEKGKEVHGSSSN